MNGMWLPFFCNGEIKPMFLDNMKQRFQDFARDWQPRLRRETSQLDKSSRLDKQDNIALCFIFLAGRGLGLGFVIGQ